MARFDDRLGVRRDELGAQLEDVRAAQGDASDVDSAGSGDLNVDPSFTPVYDLSDKRGVYVTLAFFIPTDTEELKILLVESAQMTSETNYKQKRHKVDLANAIEDEHRAAARVVDRLDKLLKYGTEYQIIKLTSQAFGRAAISNPTNTDFSGYPGNVLFTFTTPEPFGVPSSPSLALLRNELDPKTKALDCILGLKVQAPTTDVGAAQTWVASKVDNVVAVVHRTDIVPNVRVDIKTYEVTDQDTAVDPTSTPANRGIVELIKEGLRAGAAYSWIRNVAKTNGEQVSSTGPPVAFIGGNIATNPALLTSLSITVAATDKYDGKNRFLSFNYTQPAIPVGLKSFRGRTKVLGQPDTSYDRVADRFDVFNDEQWSQTGAKTFPIGLVRFKHDVTTTVQIQVRAIGNTDLFVTFNVPAGFVGEVPADTTVPIITATPELRFHPGKKFFCENMVVADQFNTGKAKYVVITNGASFFDLKGYITNNGADTGSPYLTSEVNARKRIGAGKEEREFSIKLAALKRAFGSTGVIWFYWYAENQVGLSAASPNSNTLNLATAKDNVNNGDAISRVSSSVVPLGKQIFRNANLLRLEGGGPAIRNWKRWTSGSFPISGADQDITPGSANISYLAATPSLVFTTTNQRLVQNIGTGRIQAGQPMTLTFQVRASFGTAVGLTIRFYILDDNGNQNISGGFATFLFFGGIRSTFKEVGVPFNIIDFPSIHTGAAGIDQWAVFELSGALSGNQIEIAAPMLERGHDPGKFDIREEDEGVMEIFPSGGSGAPTNDNTNVCGADGGWFEASSLPIGGDVTRTVGA